MGRIVADEIRARRKATKLNQADFAHIAGIPERTYQDYETGKRPIPSDRLTAIARALGCRVSDLTGDAQPDQPKDKTDRILEILEKRLPEPAPAPIPINQAELDRLKAQVQELTEKLQEKERLIGPHALLLKELKKARPAQVASAYAPFPGLEVPEGVIGEDK